MRVPAWLVLVAALAVADILWGRLMSRAPRTWLVRLEGLGQDAEPVLRSLIWRAGPEDRVWIVDEGHISSDARAVLERLERLVPFEVVPPDAVPHTPRVVHLPQGGRWRRHPG